MMNFLFSRRFNYFDVVCLCAITIVAATSSFWWFLAFIPQVFVSVLGEAYIEKNRG